MANFANAGHESQPKGTPPAVRVHEFPSDAEGRRFRTASSTWPAMRRGCAWDATTMRRRSRWLRFGTGGSVWGSVNAHPKLSESEQIVDRNILGRGLGIDRQEPIRTSVRGAVVKAVSPANRGPSAARRLDDGEQHAHADGLTMPPEATTSCGRPAGRLVQFLAPGNKSAYPEATSLYITAAAGRSNGYRARSWKHELQKLADETRLTIHVSHFPPGTSKWNKVEHRLFCHITWNWRGTTLTTYETIVDRIGNTRTEAGLRVHAELETGEYPTGVKGDQVANGRPRAGSRRVSRRLELQARPSMKLANPYRSLSLVARGGSGVSLSRQVRWLGDGRSAATSRSPDGNRDHSPLEGCPSDTGRRRGTVCQGASRASNSPSAGR